MHGEHTPPSLETPPILTPLGAQQLYAQGSAFRNRYLRQLECANDIFAPIVDIEHDAINNAQLNITSSTDSYTFGSSLAFLQGLYPPFRQSICNATAMEIAQLANGCVVDYPLCGYQYPNIKTVDAEYDPDSIWVQGNKKCNILMENKGKKGKKGKKSKKGKKAGDHATSDTASKSQPFFQSLHDRIFKDAFPESETNFFNAKKLYDYAAYRWNRDNETRSAMTPAELEQLRQLASEEQRAKNANLIASGDTEGDMAGGIAGRTLAARVMDILYGNIESKGEKNKLSLVFTSHEPFIAFFELAKLTTGPSAEVFTQLPGHGAAMTFELFSIPPRGYFKDNKTDHAYPSIEGLWVRFLYRSSTDPCSRFDVYPIFDDSPTAYLALPFREFANHMEVVKADAKQWCRLCENKGSICAAPPSRRTGWMIGVAAFAAAVSVGSLGLLLLA
ncbi:hypothetical protein VTK56DRAFT_3441 [Thermocarpiscus australiensis]